MRKIFTLRNPLSHPILVGLEYIALYYLGYRLGPFVFKSSLQTEFYILLCGLVLLWLLIKINGYSKRELGLEPFFEKAYLAPYIAVVLLAISLLSLGKVLGLKPLPKEVAPIPFVVIFSLASAFCQEVMFRSYLTQRLQILTRNPLLIILFVSLAFAWWHTPFGSLYIIMGSFMFSIAWTWLYLKYKCLVLAWLSHAIIHLTLGLLFVF